MFEINYRHLPYLAYNDKCNMYLNKNNFVNFLTLLEINKSFKKEMQYFVEYFLNLLEIISFEDCISLHLYSNTIFSFLKSKQFYQNHISKITNYPDKEVLREYSIFLEKSCIEPTFEILLKNFYFLISTQIHLNNYNDDKQMELNNYFEKIIKPFFKLSPDNFINFMRHYLFDKIKPKKWDQTQYIANQIFDLNDKIVHSENRIFANDKKFACLSFKFFNLDEIFYSSFLELLLHLKSNFQLTFFLKKKDVEQFYILPFIWVWDFNERNLQQSILELKHYFAEIEMPLGEESILLPFLFLNALPGNFEMDINLLQSINRYFLLSKDQLFNLLPLNQKGFYYYNHFYNDINFNVLPYKQKVKTA